MRKCEAPSGAAAHPCGLGLPLRTYDKVYEFTAPAGQGVEAAFNSTPKVVAMPSEPQSEGIAYLRRRAGLPHLGRRRRCAHHAGGLRP